MKNKLQNDLRILKTLKGRLIVTLIIGFIGGFYGHSFHLTYRELELEKYYKNIFEQRTTMLYFWKWSAFGFIVTYLLSAWLYNDKTE